MLTFQNEDLTARIKEDLNVDATGRDFLPLPDLEQRVRDDVETLRSPS
jgi:carbonic anhydrase